MLACIAKMCYAITSIFEWDKAQIIPTQNRAQNHPEGSPFWFSGPGSQLPKAIWEYHCSPGGHLYLKLDIICVKKNHVIRVVFRDQAMYARTSFRGVKICKIGKKGVFLVIWQFGKDMTYKLKKNACKNVYLGSIFIPGKYVFRVRFESPFTRMISSLKYKWPPGIVDTSNYAPTLNSITLQLLISASHYTITYILIVNKISFIVNLNKTNELDHE